MGDVPRLEVVETYLHFNFNLFIHDYFFIAIKNIVLMFIVLTMMMPVAIGVANCRERSDLGHLFERRSARATDRRIL